MHIFAYFIDFVVNCLFFVILHILKSSNQFKEMLSYFIFNVITKRVRHTNYYFTDSNEKYNP